MKGKDALLDALGFLPANKTLLEAKLAFELYNLEYLAIVDAERTPVGVLGQRHIAELVHGGLPLTTRVTELEYRAAPCVRSEDEAYPIIDYETPAVFLVDALGQAVGLVTRQTLLRSYLSKLEVANANFRAIIEVIDAVLIAVDTRGTIVYANSAAESLIVSCSGRHALGTSVPDCFPSDAKSHLDQTQREKVIFVSTLAGRTFLVRGVPLRRQESHTGAMLVLEDISEQEACKTELEEERRHSDILKTILEIAYDGIVVVDKHGLITMMSQAYLNFLGLKQENVIGRHVTDVVENTRMHIVLQRGFPKLPTCN